MADQGEGGQTAAFQKGEWIEPPPQALCDLEAVDSRFRVPCWRDQS